MSTEHATLRDLLAGASLEATPQWVSKQPPLRTLLPPAMPVYLPYHPKVDYQETVDAVGVLAAAGLCPVPHFPVRAIASREQARDRLAALAYAGADALLLIAGDQDEPAGPYANTMDLLETGFLAEHGFYRLGVAGHPEGHRRVSEEELARALAVKRDYAAATGTQMWVVTQFLLSAESAIGWLSRMREAIDPLSIHIGVPGPTRLRTLLSYAAQCGVGASAKFLTRQAGVTRLLGGWSPEGLVRELADRGLSSEGRLFSGLHFYPFGDVARCAEWISDLRARIAEEEEEGNAQALRAPACFAGPASIAGEARASDDTQAATACWATTESER